MSIQSVGVIGPVLQFTDAAGVPYAGGSLTFVATGTSTALSVYSDAALTVSLGNIVTLNAAGRTSTSASGPDTAVYCQPLAYDYTLKDAAGSTIWGPVTFSGSQWPGSIQSISTLAPLVNANGYANRITPTITKAASGTHSLFAGTRLDALAVGAGASTLTEAATLYIEGAPNAGTAAYALHIGSVNGGAVRFDGPVTFGGGAPSGCNGRLTLTSGSPVTTGEVTAATSIYFAPYLGNAIGLYDGSAWQQISFTELTLAVPATTATGYDIFCYSNSGTATLEALAWTSLTARATSLTTQNGVLVKSGAATRRYLGSFRTTGVSGQTEDSFTKRYLWNYYNRIERELRRVESTASWTYSTATIRQANGAAANQVETFVGVAEAMLHLSLTVVVQNDTGGGVNVQAGIGEGSTTTFSANGIGGGILIRTANENLPCWMRLDKYPAIGYQFWSWNEWAAASGATAWQALNTPGAGSGSNGGLQGWIFG